MKINSFRDLRVWKAGIDLVEEVYRLTQLFPQYEIYSLANQMRRAAVSIPSNIAEGHEREHLKEYTHHLSIAQGSLAELVTQIEIAARLNYLAQDRFNQILGETDSLGKQLRALRSSLMNSCKS
jgi:four helix bundle protein